MPDEKDVPQEGQEEVEEQAATETTGEDITSELLEGQPDTGEPTRQSDSERDPLQDSAPPPSTSPTFSDRLSELGFEGVEDDAQGQERLLSSYQQMNARLAQLEQLSEANSQLVNYGKQYLETLQTPSVPGAQAPDEPKSWRQEPPKFDRGWLERYGDRDETGNFRWKDNTPAEVRAGTEAYQAYVDQWADDLTHRPEEALGPLIRQEAQRMFEELYQDRRSRESEESFIDELRRNNEWIYEKDPRTNRLTNNFSQEGQRVMELVGEAEDLGITDTRRQWQYATRLYEAEQAKANGQATEKSRTAQDVAADKRKQHLERAMSDPNRSGAAPSREQADERPRNVNNRPGQDLLQQLETDGVGIL